MIFEAAEFLLHIRNIDNLLSIYFILLTLFILR